MIFSLPTCKFFIEKLDFLVDLSDFYLNKCGVLNVEKLLKLLIHSNNKFIDCLFKLILNPTSFFRQFQKFFSHFSIFNSRGIGQIKDVGLNFYFMVPGNCCEQPRCFYKTYKNGWTNFKSEVLFLLDSQYFPGIEKFSSISTPVNHLFIFEANIMSNIMSPIFDFQSLKFRL